MSASSGYPLVFVAGFWTPMATTLLKRQSSQVGGKEGRYKWLAAPLAPMPRCCLQLLPASGDHATPQVELANRPQPANPLSEQVENLQALLGAPAVLSKAWLSSCRH
eukprot:2244591-Amphidinium_carterae.2